MRFLRKKKGVIKKTCYFFLVFIELVCTENIRFERMRFFKPNKFQAYRYKPLSQFSYYYNTYILFLASITYIFIKIGGELFLPNNEKIQANKKKLIYI